MPPKKKKPPFNEESTGGVLDIFGYIELIEECLKVADTNESCCIDGISKANVALQQIKEDPDIQCIVLMKRAELLYTAVSNDYDTDDFKDPLDSCIEDCEQVLSKVSSANGTGKSLHEKASSLLEEAKDLKKVLRKEARAKKKSNGEKVSYSVFQRYDPTKALFKHVSKINSYLLQDVVDCYKKAKNICRTCYYKRDRIEQLSVSNRFCKSCKKVGQPLLLIPASKMCDNLAGTSSVAVPPPPKMLMSKINKHKPFQMCKNKDHSMCREKLSNGETWFAHSIEELVIWTLERHFGCRFSEYVRSHHTNSESPNHKLFGDAIEITQGADYMEEYYDDNDDEYDYHPEDCMFKNVAAIPQALLLNVIELYSRSKEYCKWCYYKDNKKSIVKFDRSSNEMVCSSCHKPWDLVVVMPASDLCWNFGSFDHLPIAPWPQGKPIKDSFEYCQKKDHFRCFRVYVESEFWYPHSVEEMIVWTVERERGCTFPAFIESVSRIPDSLLPSKTSPNRSYSVTSTRATSTPNTTNKAHQQTLVNTSKSKPTMATKVMPKSAAPPISGTVSQGHMTSVAPVSSSKQYAVHNGATPNGATPYGSTVTTTVTQPTHPPRTLMSTISNFSDTAAMYPYTMGSMYGLPHLVNDSHSMMTYLSSIQEFKPSEATKVTAIGITIATSPGGIYGNATITTSAVGSGKFSSMAAQAGHGYRMGSTTYEVQSSHTPLPAVISPTATGSSQQVYKFMEVNFKTLADIPLSLLKGISSCFQSKKEVCRLCFYEERVLSELVPSSNTCSNEGHSWSKPLLVIPGCILCDNEPCFERGDPVPLPPLPPVATIKKCPQKNHHKCYTKSLKSNEMFAHSVEALVVWIVESEEECSFEEFAAEKLNRLSGGSYSTRASLTPPPVVVPSASPAPSSPKPSTLFKSLTPPPHKPPNPTIRSQVFHPREVEFGTIGDIPSELLASVAECFKSCTFVCRLCFFDSDCKNLIQKIEKDNYFVCPYGHNPWREIKVIPKCKLCASPSDWIPVPPLPKHMKQSKKAFVMCKKQEHSTCYAMSKGTNPWFPHTVEEMVIWTVERETGKQYEEVYKQFLTTHPPPFPSKPLQQESLKPSNRPMQLPYTTGVMIQPPKPSQQGIAKTAFTNSNQPITSQTPQTGPHISQAPQAKPPGISEHKHPSLSIPIPQSNPSFLLGGIQSPTLNSDLEEAIKLANSSLATTVQTQPPKSSPQPTLPVSANTNNMFGAFPNVLTNILPQSGSGASSSNSGYSGLYNGRSLTDDALGGFFPALLGAPDTLGFGPGDSYSNSSSSTSIHVNDNATVQSSQVNLVATSQAALQGWMSAPATNSNNSHEKQVSSHNRQKLSHDKPKRDIWQESQNRPPPSNGFHQENPIRPKLNSNPHTKQGTEKLPSHKSQLPPLATFDPTLAVPRMPNSDPMVLEKALEAEGFVKVKSKRQKKLPKVDPSFISTPTGVTKSNRFTDLDLDSMTSDSLSSGENGITDKLPQLSNGQSSGEFNTSSLETIQSNSKLPQLNNGYSTVEGPQSGLSVANGVATAASGTPSGTGFDNLSGGFEPQFNDEADKNPRSSSIRNAGLTGANVCAICYQRFSNDKAFAAHCQSASHCSAVALTVGGNKLLKYAPPHPKSQHTKLCTKPKCCGAPECPLAHSKEQLSSWRQEWALVRKSATPAKGLSPKMLLPPVDQTQFTGGLRLSQDTTTSQYPNVVVTSDQRMSVTAKPGEGSIKWSITLKGQNWQTLFGVYCHALPSSNPANPTSSQSVPTFTITSISSGHRTVAGSGPIWKAESIAAGFLLGRVVVSVTAHVGAMRTGTVESCELRLNLGHKEFLYLPISVKVEGEVKLMPKRSHPTVDPVNTPVTFDNLSPAVPLMLQQNWNLSYDSSSSEELDILNIEGEDTSVQHVSIEDWGLSLTGDTIL